MPAMTTLRVGGFTPLSSSDWPGMLASVLFCQGCAWHCRYCHNPDLIPSQSESELAWEDVLAFLQRRQGLLDGVVFSGGEPTLQAALSDAMREVHALGFKIGLHTAGMYPKRLEAVLPLIDWIGMDVKAPFADYARITGVKESGAQVRESLQLLLESGVDHEIRTTVHPALLADEEVIDLAKELSACGVKRYAVQAFRSQGCRDESLCHNALRFQPLQQMGAKLAGLFESFELRTA